MHTITYCHNLQKFEELLEDYWDVQLLSFLKFGFPLSFPRECRSELGKNLGNHASATQFSSDIQKYLDTEIQYKAISGPYDRPPFGASSHFSPFMS